MVRDEVLSPFGDPGKIADAELAASRNASAINSRVGSPSARNVLRSECASCTDGRTARSSAFEQIEAKQIAAVVSHQKTA